MIHPTLEFTTPMPGRMGVSRAAIALCFLLTAGCAAVGPPPQPEAPPALSAPVGMPVDSPGAVPAARAADAPPQRVAQPALATPAPAAAQAVPRVERAAPLPPARDLTRPLSSAPKVPAKVAVAPAPAAALAPVAPAPKAQMQEPPLAKPTPAPPLDLKLLETRLKETKAIGVFTKLTLKNQIDDLLDRFRAFYQGRLKTSLVELRRAFEMLVLKTVALLQDADPPLASAIVSSRESIWDVLSNPAKFGSL